MTTLPCYAAEQATKYSLSKRYGVACSRAEYLSELMEAANLLMLRDLPTCVSTSEKISCFLKGKSVDPCSPITIKDCSGLVVAFVEPTPTPCYLTITFI